MAQIDKPNLHFNTVTYSNAGDGAKAVTGVGFQPDWVWLKNRSSAYHHQLFDAVRGATSGVLYSSTNSAVDTGYPLTSFDSDGFTTGSQSSNEGQNSASQVAWNWKANGAGSSNTDGDVTSTVSANTTARFSIVKWTGTGSGSIGVGHGLGVTPKIVIVKNLNGTLIDWHFYNTILDNSLDILYLNTTGAKADSGASLPTNSVFNTISVTNNANDYIAYCFAEKKGYSKFGSYSGNADADGPFIYTGFKPAFVILKSINNGGWHWRLMDTVRDNNRNDGTNNLLFPNHQNAEVTNELDIDYLSNGFKIRDARTGINGSGWTVMYMAFAKNPIVGSNDVPATAI
jgi:hypothetical protein